MSLFSSSGNQSRMRQMQENQKKKKTSPGTNPLKKETSLHASLTAEAAWALPLFLFAAFLLMMPFRVMDTGRQMQAAAEAAEDLVGEEILLWRESGQGTLPETAALALAEGLLRQKAGGLPLEGLTLGRSELVTEDGQIRLIAEYRVKLPFSVFGKRTFAQTAACFGRAWIGRDGLSAGMGEEEEDGTIWVYVGQNSTRYHRDRFCHYLFHNLRAVSFAVIGEYRNQSGSRYTPCARCGDRAAELVYILPSGEHYHTDQNCSSLQAYVSRVPLEEVEALGPCSYCSREESGK